MDQIWIPALERSWRVRSQASPSDLPRFPSACGYRTSVQMWHEGVLLEGWHEGVLVEPRRMTGADIVLHVSNESVTVEGNAGGGAFMLADGSTGLGLSRPSETTSLINGATLQSLLALVPGVVVTESAGTLTQFTAAGQRRFANRVTVDGVSAISLSMSQARGRRIRFGGLAGGSDIEQSANTRSVQRD